MLRDSLDYAMKNERKIRAAIVEKKLDRCLPSGGGHTGISRPTEMLALKNLEPVGSVVIDGFVVIAEPERTIRVVQQVKLHFISTPHAKVYKLHYIEQIEDYKCICDKLNISKSTYYNYINQILDYAEMEWERNDTIC